MEQTGHLCCCQCGLELVREEQHGSLTARLYLGTHTVPGGWLKVPGGSGTAQPPSLLPWGWAAGPGGSGVRPQLSPGWDSSGWCHLCLVQLSCHKCFTFVCVHLGD